MPAITTRALIIGSGFSGLGMAIALKKQGVDEVAQLLYDWTHPATADAPANAPVLAPDE